MTGEQSSPLNLFEYETAAQARLPTMAWDYYAGGAADEITLRENRAAYDRIRLRYRVLRDVSKRSLSTTILGQPVSMPILVAPTAFHGLAHPDREVATVRAAGAVGTIFTLSTLSNAGPAEVAAAATGPIWFQLYVFTDRRATVDLVRRVEASGFSALMLTADSPVLGRRERDVRNQFQLPSWLSVDTLAAISFPGVRAGGGSGLASVFSTLIDPALSWADVEWLRGITSLPILVKGIVRADDALRAAELGVDGLVVSNHGGRQLDTAPATIDVLAEVTQAVGGRVPVLVDGGIRRGTDVVKALARGAAAVMIGRPVLWGLATDGENGVRNVLELLRAELDTAMALCGCASLADLTPDLVL